METKLARALTIAGSDSGGGAGIQADLKTFTALGVFGTSALTAITAQNTLGVQAVLSLPVELVTQQIDSVMSDIGTDAAKTGMLADPALIEVVADKVRQYGIERLVVDPVVVAKGGDVLVPAAAQAALRRLLLPLALVVTPNRYEAAALAGRPVDSVATMGEAARAIAALGARYVVVKGGGLTPEALDVLYDGSTLREVSGERIETRSLHGTGCTFSAAIAAGLARGLTVPDAVFAAKAFVTSAIKHARPIGGGHGPTNHLFGITLA